MENFALILLCPLAGYLISRRGLLPRDSYKAVNAWILYIALPALSLRYIPAINWHFGMLLPVLGAGLIWCGAWLYVGLYARKKRLDIHTKTALLLTCGLGNTAFLGFPLTTAFFGKEALPIAIVFDLSGFILFSTVAVLVVLKAADKSGKSPGLGLLLKKMLAFPSALACLFAFAVPPFLNISFMNPLFDMIVPTISPLALFSIGLQLEFKGYGENAGHIVTGLLYKLVLAPLLVLLLALAMKGTAEVARVSVLEAGMAPHITASLLASQFNHNPRLCSLMVTTGIILTLGTTTLWWLITGRLF